MPARFFLLTSALLFVASSGFCQKFKNLETALKSPEKVTTLELRKDKLTSIPSEILAFKNLEILDLSNNQISEVKVDLSVLTKLHTIILSKNKLARFPMEFSSIPNLKILGLDRNPIDSIPDAIIQFRALEQLDLWDCDIEYVSLEILNMPNLSYLDLRNTYFKSEELKWISEGSKTIELKSTYGCNCD